MDPIKVALFSVEQSNNFAEEEITWLWKQLRASERGGIERALKLRDSEGSVVVAQERWTCLQTVWQCCPQARVSLLRLVRKNYWAGVTTVGNVTAVDHAGNYLRSYSSGLYHCKNRSAFPLVPSTDIVGSCMFFFPSSFCCVIKIVLWKQLSCVEGYCEDSRKMMTTTKVRGKTRVISSKLCA